MKNNILSAIGAKFESATNVNNADNWASHAQTGPTLSEVYEANCRQKGTSATAEVTYVTISKAIKMINVALENNTAKGESKAINAPTLKAELASTGHDKFCIDCLDFMYGTHTLLCAPKAGESDFVLIHARKDSEGRNTYRLVDLIRCFEAKYASIFEAQKAAKAAEREAEKAAKAAERAKKNAEKADALKQAKANLEATFGRTLSNEEFEKMVAILGKAC